MLISHEQLREINEVQIEILRAVSDVCKQLGIPFFMVHGSLLGTIRDHKFVPGDDDIDIALFRKDYDRFVKDAPALLNERYFIQTCQSDPAYPLGFGKVRDSETTYIIEDARHLRMNHGIYIDVFPIDHCEKPGKKAKLIAYKHKLLNMRIAAVFDLKNQSAKKKLVRFATKLLYPSHAAAIRAREQLLTGCAESGYVRVSGGKGKEQGMPLAWFENAVPETFEGVDVFIPSGYDHYLTRIYGDYRNRTLVENKVSDEQNIEVNACVVDVKTPYTQYR